MKALYVHINDLRLESAEHRSVGNDRPVRILRMDITSSYARILMDRAIPPSNFIPVTNGDAFDLVRLRTFIRHVEAYRVLNGSRVFPYGVPHSNVHCRGGPDLFAHDVD